MSSKFDDYNEFYQFMRSAVVHFYNECNEKSYNRYYSRYLDDGLKCSDYLEFLEIMFTHLYEDK